MERKYLTVLGIAAVAVILLGAAGIGYATYMGNTYSEHDTMDVKENRIDIYKDGVPIGKSMDMPSFVRGETVYISGYRIATTGPGTINLQCQMANGAAWELIESMTLSVEDVSHPDPYPFGIDRSVSPIQTGIRTGNIEMNEELVFTPAGGETLLYYNFTITVTFTDIDVTEDPFWETLSTFEGSEFVFYYNAA